MKNLFTALLILVFAGVAHAQDLNSESRSGLNLVKPGVRNDGPSKGLEVIYGVRPGFDLGDSETVGAQPISHFDNLTVKLKIPVVYKPKDFKAVIGVAYNYEKYLLDNDAAVDPFYRELDNDALKSVRATAYLAKMFDSKIYTVLRLEAAYNGNYDKLVNYDEQFRALRAALIVGYKPSEDVEYGFGGFVNNTFRRTSIWPILMFNKTFNDKWGFESVVPVRLLFRYNQNEGSLFYFGTEYASREHSLDILNQFGLDEVRETNIYFRRQSAQLNVEWQKHLFSWVWMKAKVGFNYNFNTQVYQPDEPTFDPREPNALLPVEHGPVGRIGIFLSPPRTMLEKAQGNGG